MISSFEKIGKDILPKKPGNKKIFYGVYKGEKYYGEHVVIIDWDAD